MMIITHAQKLASVEREIVMRRKVYANRVRNGLMRQALADHEIAVMEAIAQDYRNSIAPTLDLVFKGYSNDDPD